MKVIIAGGRDFDDYLTLNCEIDFLNNHYFKLEIVCGGARGADTLAENYAKQLGLPVKVFPADWDKHGKSAGYLRNQQMAEYADMLVAFWDGKSKGTKHMIDLALIHKLETHVKFY
jgi:hypothetical protein